MDCYEQTLELIYDAIHGVNQTLRPEQILERSPDTIVLGESTKLDSLGLVNLVVSIEENVGRVFNKEISLVDIIGGSTQGHWTVAALAKFISELVDGSAPEQRRCQASASI
jgi:acyl carrier protein